VSIQSRHPEVAEPQPNRSMQDLNCHPELDSGSSHCDDEGSPLTPTLSCTSLRIQAHKTRPSSVRFASRRARGQRVAFTLAEVLITLAIIGVVAAMTIPTLINNYQEKITVTKVKKMYTVLSNAYSLYKIENGPLPLLGGSYEEVGDPQRVYNVFKSNLKIAVDCGTLDENYSCVPAGYKGKNGADNYWDYATAEYYYKLILNDGSLIFFRDGGVDSSAHMFYDVNGKNGPNIWGYDLFNFIIYPDGIYPGGLISADVDQDCLAADGFGYGCSSWIIYKGNMDYLKCPDELTWEDSKCPE